MLWPHSWWARSLVLPVHAAIVALILFVASAWSVSFPKALFERIPASQVIYDREGNVLRVFRNCDDNFLIPIDPCDVSPHLVEATIAVEDKRFMSHYGVDPLAVLRAVWQDVTSLRIVSGASTLTMQVARLLDPAPRTVTSKVREAFRALQLERCYTKEQILSLYLTLAPYGGNIYGAEAASLAYFGKRARELTLAEAALLAGLPQSPTRYRLDQHIDRALKRRDTVVRAMRETGSLSKSESDFLMGKGAYDLGAEADKGSVQHAEWMQDQYTGRRFPFEAPHFCRLLAARHPEISRFHTTVDLGLQKRLERFLRASVKKLSGVTNMSCMVVENKTGEVRAYMGSVDFWSETDAGQVDGLRAFRSPGSTLKPFLYGICYTEGLLAPDEQLPDVPLLNSSWTPENYDLEARGLVPAQEALAESYNLPAVRLLKRYGAAKFYSFLQRRRILREHNVLPNLSLILGSLDARAIDIAQGYTALANFGRLQSLTLLRPGDPDAVSCPGFADEATVAAGDSGDRQEQKTAEMFSPEACYLVSEALTHPQVRRERIRGFAWKTGTSWGRRDAWTVAYTPKYTVCLWVGNFSGDASPVLIGSKAAMPFAVEVLSWLDPEPKWPRRPEGIASGTICMRTGMRSGAFCPHCIKGRVLENDRRTCTVHRRIPLDSGTGCRLCLDCIQGKEVSWNVYEMWPDDIEMYLQINGKPPLPMHNPDCAKALDSGITFLSPLQGCSYLLSEKRLPVRVFSQNSSLTFFLNGKKIEQKTPLFSLALPKGWHTLSCIDSQGRNAKVRFRCVSKEY